MVCLGVMVARRYLNGAAGTAGPAGLVLTVRRHSALGAGAVVHVDLVVLCCWLGVGRYGQVLVPEVFVVCCKIQADEGFNTRSNLWVGERGLLLTTSILPPSLLPSTTLPLKLDSCPFWSRTPRFCCIGKVDSAGSLLLWLHEANHPPNATSIHEQEGCIQAANPPTSAPLHPISQPVCICKSKLTPPE
jgi:hypothetical protein